MALNDMETYVMEHFPNVYVPRNLLEVSKAVAVKYPSRAGTNHKLPHQNCRSPGLYLLIDGEQCLDRLYGGFFTDWACGGQWNRVLEFLGLLFATMKSGNIHPVVFFNGALEERRMCEWSNKQTLVAERVRQVLQHVKRKRTPPPKVLWMAPAGLRTCLRLALKQCMIPVHMTLDDHIQEVMTFVREQKFDAVVADGSEYLFCDPPRLYSASSLRLTFKGSIDVKQLLVEDVAICLDLHPNRFCLIPAILGNFMLAREEFAEFYDRLLPTATPEEKKNLGVLIPTVMAFIRNLPDVDDILAVGRVIFSEKENCDTKARVFQESVRYYINATKEGFHKYFRPKTLKDVAESHEFASESQTDQSESGNGTPEIDSDSSKHAETNGTESTVSDETEEFCQSTSGSLEVGSPKSTKEKTDGDNGVLAAITAAQTVYHSVPSSSPGAPSLTTANESGPPVSLHFVPKIAEEILRAASHRHFRGLMHPWIFQILSKAEIKLETNLEEGLDLPFGWKVWRGVRQSVYAILFDVNHKKFLLNSQKARHTPAKSKKSSTGINAATANKENGANGTHGEVSTNDAQKEPPNAKSGLEPAGKYPQELSTRIFVKEWVLVPRKNLYERPEMVDTVALPWGRVPTVRKLWFDKHPSVREKRMKAFLACFLSDTPLIMNNKYVPQQFLVLCCVLRYMIAYTEHPQRILEQHELNAFLAAAVSPQRLDPNMMQSIPVQNLSTRGVQLANLLMQGVDHAALTNDACGAPIPWTCLCPWLFFDGKLFQLKLEVALRNADSLMDLCNGDLEQLAKVERMKRAIVEGLEFLFTLPRPQALAMMNPVIAAQVHERLAAVARGRGMMGRREILARGGQLKIGGVVVSHWGGHADQIQAPQNNQIRGQQSPQRGASNANRGQGRGMNSVGKSNRGRGEPLRSLGTVRLGSTRFNQPSQIVPNRQPPPPPIMITQQSLIRSPSIPAVGFGGGYRTATYHVGGTITTMASPPERQQIDCVRYGLGSPANRYQQASYPTMRGRGIGFQTYPQGQWAGTF